MTKTAKPITLSLDASAFEAALKEFQELLPSAPKGVFENLVRLGDVPEQLFRIGENGAAAAATSEVLVRLEPTDFLARLLAAMRTGDWDRLAGDSGFDFIRHDLSSVGGLEPASEEQASAESQGPADACPGNSQRGPA